MSRRSCFLFAAVALAACGLDAVGSMATRDEVAPPDGSTPSGEDDASVDSFVPAPDAGLDAPIDAARPPGLIFAASATALWKLDTSGPTEQIAKVGDFGASCDDEDIEELAVDTNGVLYGTWLDNRGFMRITADAGTVSCTDIASNTAMPYALAWVAPGVLDAGQTLVAYADDGSYERVDPATGARTTIAGLGLNGFAPGGDLAAADGVTGYVIARDTGDCDFCLVRVDLRTGVRTSAALADFDNAFVYGLAVGSNGKIYAFPNDRAEIYVLTPPTFTVTTIPAPNGAIRWRGATSRPLP